MISIKSKKKEDILSAEEVLSFVPLEKNEAIIDGGLTLVDIIYQTLSSDTVGLMQIQQCIDFTEHQNELIEQPKEELSKLDSASTAILEVISSLTNVVETKQDTIEGMCKALVDINRVTASLLNQCKEFRENKIFILNHIYTLKGLIHSAKNELNEESFAMSKYIYQMEFELKKLEASIAIAYTKNDQQLTYLTNISENSNFYYQHGLSYDEKIQTTISHINEIVQKLYDTQAKIDSAKKIDGMIETLKENNTRMRKSLNQRKEKNTGTLNDLVSFLIQLKSILNYLKEEPKHV